MMTPQEILDWYTSKPRVCTPERVAQIAFDNIRPSRVQHMIPHLGYFRTIERNTPTLYLPELLPTPSGRHPTVGKFIRIWSAEETTHGLLFDRVLAHCGEGGYLKPRPPRISAFERTLKNAAGNIFIAVHMTWGMANELLTRAGYVELLKITEDPVIEEIINCIIPEETRHYTVYRQNAEYFLSRSHVARLCTYYVMKKFWMPVGTPDSSLQEARPVFELFDGSKMSIIEKKVAKKVRKLPGLANLDIMPAVIRCHNTAMAIS